MTDEIARLLDANQKVIDQHAELTRNEPMTEDRLKVGDRFRFNAINWSLISAKSLPPQWRTLTVVALTDNDVWYRFDDETETKQTSVERWNEIAQTVFHHGQHDLQRVAA